MNMDFKIKLDSMKDGTKEVAELTHETVETFHKNYVSEIVPNTGKYGDTAKFFAEMVPGVSEYNAIREGDWQEFAIAAGLDVGAIALGAVTGGAAFMALKGGSKAAAKAGVKKASKEVVGASTRKVVKEVTEKSTKETVEKTVKKVGDKMNKELFSPYLKDVEKITNREIKPNQLEKLKKALDEKEFVKLDSEATKASREAFNNIRKSAIEAWEKNTGQTWPRYTEDVVNEAGKVVRRKGQPYDAHHLIELDFGGPHEWWNLHPAKFSVEHQGAIHAADSLMKLVF